MFSVAMNDVKTQSNLERKGFTWLVNHLVKSTEELKRSLEVGTEAETMEESCLLACSPVLFSLPY